jgi:hypothetical protein
MTRGCTGGAAEMSALGRDAQGSQEAGGGGGGGGCACGQGGAASAAQWSRASGGSKPPLGSLAGRLRREEARATPASRGEGEGSAA